MNEIFRTEINPVEKDKIGREAVKEAIKALCPVLGLRYVSITDRLLQIGKEDKQYMIGGVMGMSSHAIGKCIADIVETGSCDWEHVVKTIETPQKKVKGRKNK